MKILILSLFLMMSAVVSSATDDHYSPTLNVKKGDHYITIDIDCINIDEECTEVFTSEDMTKIKTIAKLKSYKSWMRLMKSGQLELISVKYRYNKKVLTFIICKSHEYKLVSNRYGNEILKMKKE